MDLTWSLRRRVEPSSLTALLAAGDLVAIGVFVVAGELSHGYSLVDDGGRFVGTLVPFLLGWIPVSILGNLYTPDAVANLRRALSWTVPAWAVAVIIAQALRATSVFHGDLAATFALVSFGVGGALIVAWRSLVTLVT